MASSHYQIGDLVFAVEDIVNDGGIPDVGEEAVIAAAGSRGVVVDCGFAALDAKRAVYLVRFEEDPEAMLGKPVACLPEELTQVQAAAA